ncbi:MAG: glycosyltransferase family 39 protein [Acidobacteria bacterium]|nr:glycosyltransferase family 39 protein [Acidobacteriota bacterium]
MNLRTSTLSIIERRGPLIVVLIAAIIFLCGTISPPSLLDDVDAVHGAIGRNMLRSGDWITPHLNGLVYLDKAPLTYWLIAASYSIFGVQDWAARMPIALAAILLCWMTARFGRWAFSARTGFYAGLTLATCIGLYLFTRILIPEVILTLTVSLSVWAFLRLQEPDRDGTEPHRTRWIILFGVGLGAGLLLKGLLGLVAPAGAIFFYLLASRQLFSAQAWRSHHFLKTLGMGTAIGLAIAAPWYVAATLANPPYFDLTLQSGEGVFRGFFWRYFINEHLLRYLGERLPKDYDTVPLIPFWLLHVVWLFPWSVYLPSLLRLSFKPVDRAGRVRLMAVCWALFLLVFFSFSTSQEYYTMPIYPALALLIASGINGAMKDESSARTHLIHYGTVTAGFLLSLGALTCAGLLTHVWSLPADGDISSALTSNPDAYTLSLGHMSDLTVSSFAYLRLPLGLAALAFAIGAGGCFVHVAKHRKQMTQRSGGESRSEAHFHWSAAPPWLAFALMMILFTNAARIAMTAFDPYLSSRPLAEALRSAPPGKLIINGAYYPFSSVVFYADRDALLLNGHFNNLEYGSNAPGAPNIFIDTDQFRTMWGSGERVYLLTTDEELKKGELLTGNQRMLQFATAGGKSLLTNTSLPIPKPPPEEKPQE